MKTVLVTGVAGFIGSNLAHALLERGYRVVGIDNFDDTYDAKFKEEHVAPFLTHKEFALVRMDIRDGEKLLELAKREKPSYIVHLAAKADTRNAVETPGVYISVNIEGTLNVLEAARQAGAERTVVASSSSVYGNDTEIPYKETATADRPISPYGATKRAVEHLAHTYRHNFGMNVVCLRYFNVYGENNRPTMMPYKWTEALLAGKEIELSGEGTRKRDYTYVGDAVAATILAMEKPLGFEVINIGNNNPLSLVEMLALFEKVIGVKAKVRSRKSNHPSVEITYADITKAKKLLGWEPKTSTEEGIKKLVAWFRAHRLENGK